MAESVVKRGDRYNTFYQIDSVGFAVQSDGRFQISEWTGNTRRIVTFGENGVSSEVKSTDGGSTFSTLWENNINTQQYQATLTGTIPKGSVTNNTLYYYRTGKIGCIAFDIALSSVNTTTTVFTLPDGFRPKGSIPFTIPSFGSSTVGTQYGVIHTSGACQFYSSKENSRLMGTITYPIA